MFLIFDKNNNCIGTASEPPNKNDLEKRTEVCVETKNKNIDNSTAFDYFLENGKIKKKQKENKLSLEEALEDIDSFKAEKESEAISYKNFLFQADEDSIKKLTLASMEESIKKWYDINNQPHELTSDEIRKLLALISKRNQYIYEYCMEAKNTIKKAFANSNEALVKETLNILETGYDFESE